MATVVVRGGPPERGFAASDACEWSLLDTMERPLAQAVQVNTLPLSTSQTANACHSGALTEVAPKRKGE